MKSLQESLFDSDLVSKDTGYECLYGLVDIASVSCDFNVEYLDVKKIKHDFNQIIKKFPPQDWSSSSVDSMKKFQVVDIKETLRELLYIIVCNIKTSDIKIKNHDIDERNLEDIIYKIVEKYIDDEENKFSDGYKWMEIYVDNKSYGFLEPDQTLIRVYFLLGRQSLKYSATSKAGVIRIRFNKGILI